NFGRLDGLEGDFAGLVLRDPQVEGSAFAPLTVNALSTSRDWLTLSFCARKTHFSTESLARFAALVDKIATAGVASRADQGPAAHREHAPGQALRVGPRQERGGVAPAFRLPSLSRAREPAAGLGDREWDRRGEPSLDESRRDRVDGDPARPQSRSEP